MGQFLPIVVKTDSVHILMGRFCPNRAGLEIFCFSGWFRIYYFAVYIRPLIRGTFDVDSSALVPVKGTKVYFIYSNLHLLYINIYDTDSKYNMRCYKLHALL